MKPEVDEYGRLILLKNFIHWSTGRLPGLDRALRALLHDSYFQNSVPAYAPQKIPRGTLRILERLRTDERYRARHWKRIEGGQTRTGRILDRLCLLANARSVSTSVTLIHGIADSVVPAEQSRILYETLLHHKIQGRLVVTPLISHGDSQLSLSQTPALVDLVRGFAHFFEAASEPEFAM